MMMNYRSKTKKRIFWILIFIIIFYPLLSKITGKFLNWITYPFWVTKQELKEQIISPANFLTTKKQLILKNQKLEKELEEIRISLTNQDLIIKENIELQNLLNQTPTDKKNDLILVNILTKPNLSPYDILIVDVGQNSGIKNGGRVFAYGNVLIGEVAEINQKTSKIKLYSSPQEKTDAWIGFFNIPVQLVGKGGGNFEVIVPKNTDLQINDPVFLPGTETVIIGSVKEIKMSEADSFKKILIKSPVNLFELKWIQIQKSE